ncbi:hypothetical protein K9B33_20860 [Sphingobium sp. 3R8]|uniref:hypothetical protein n=1 Tax=Sphingobium sp. 3R8 TaxID=2874921 RepID=UPI001CCCD6D3|nr:hypothetical protein [Sphingobium sp. 3R8]MBZ9649989.1 hypothetical protein [Sphingobium sp. 3R8]
MTMFRALAPALTVWAANPRVLRVVLLDAEGQPQDLTGRTATLSIRRSAMLEPRLTVQSILSADGLAWLFLLTADQCDQIYADRAYSLDYDVIETQAGGSLRWTGHIDPQPASQLPGGGAEPVVVDLPTVDLVSEIDTLAVSERGAAGFGVEKRLKDLGDIPEADPALMRDKIREWGGEGGAPFAQAAEVSAGEADAAKGAALESQSAADISANRAQLAEAGAIGGGNLYGSITAGLAATADGKTFNVAPPGAFAVAVFQRVGASAVPTGNEIPTKRAIDRATGRSRNSSSTGVVIGVRNAITGRSTGITLDGNIRFFYAYSYRNYGRNGTGKYIPLINLAGTKASLLSSDRRGRMVAAGYTTYVGKDRNRSRRYISGLGDMDGQMAVAFDRVRKRLRLADIEIPVPVRDRNSARVHDIIPIVRGKDKRILFGPQPDGMHVIFSQATIDRYNIGGGGGGSSEYRPTSEFLGSHGEVFFVQGGADYLYARMRTSDGFVGDFKQIPASTAAIPLLGEPLRYILVWGQSQAGSGSGPAGTPPITGIIGDPYIFTTDANDYASGTPARTESADPYLVSAFEPRIANQAQAPAAMAALALAKLDIRAHRRQPGTVISTAWQGGQPIGEFFPDAPNWPLFANARVQAANVKNAAPKYGRSVDYTILFIQGENASATPSYLSRLNDLIDTVLPQLGTAAGVAGSPHFLMMQTHTNGGQSEQGSGLAHVAVARARLGAGVTLAGPMYQQPVWDATHSDNIGRIMGGDTAALAYEWARIKGQTFKPLWPVTGGVTRVGAVITIPMELPLGTTALSIDTDWVAAIDKYGFKFTDDSGSTPAISSVAISGTSIIVTLASTPTGANKRIRYALDDMTPVTGWASTRGQIYADSGVPALAAAYGGPATIRHYSVRFEEIVP